MQEALVVLLLLFSLHSESVSGYVFEDNPMEVWTSWSSCSQYCGLDYISRNLTCLDRECDVYESKESRLCETLCPDPFTGVLPESSIALNKRCYVKGEEKLYRGTNTFTVTRDVCFNWSKSPLNYDLELYGEWGIGDHNYCRIIPEYGRRPGCHYRIDAKHVGWKLCGVLMCPDVIKIKTTTATLNPHIECYVEGEEEKYRGTVTQTKSGHVCEPWLDDPLTYDNEEYARCGFGDHNYCRILPGFNDPPGCHYRINATHTGWERCDVPKCPKTFIPHIDCYVHGEEENYRGTVSHSKVGHVCYPWLTKPINYTREEHVRSGFGDHNYCRILPGFHEPPGCHYKIKGTAFVGWDYCDVPRCPETFIPHIDCYVHGEEENYRGTVSHSKAGHVCHTWLTKPLKYNREEHARSGFGDHNYCRIIPGSQEPPGCHYRIKGTTKYGWDYCDVPRCPETPTKAPPTVEETTAEAPRWVWGVWSDWTPCTKTCGKALKIRTRLCFDPDNLNLCVGEFLQWALCEGTCEPTNTNYGEWSPWTGWSVCTSSCGRGRKTRKRFRSCSNLPHHYCIDRGYGSAVCWGTSCVTAFPTTKAPATTPATTETAPVEETTAPSTYPGGEWGKWTPWSPCTSPCGRGYKSRIRVCLRPICNGTSREHAFCLGLCSEPPETTTTPPATTESSTQDCYVAGEASSYRGQVSRTKTGLTCLNWNICPTKYYDEDDRNYCRSPNSASEPWCYYSTNPLVWEYCDVPVCSASTLAIEVTAPSTLPSIKDCYVIDRPTAYMGNISHTRTGLPCKKWRASSILIRTTLYGYNSNQCRNPNRREKPWCFYNLDPAEWDFCDVPVCEDDTPATIPSSPEPDTEDNGITTTASPELEIDPGNPHVDCYVIGHESKYSGEMNHTRSPTPCRSWKEYCLERHQLVTNYTGVLLGEHNYCRSLSDGEKPWCFRKDSNSEKEYCDIPVCTEAPAECYEADKASNYRGTASFTLDGYKCQIWDSPNNDMHFYRSANFPNSGLGLHNYCRTPDGDTVPWCYSSNPAKPWNYCSVFVCTDETTQEIDQYYMDPGLIATEAPSTSAFTYDCYKPHNPNSYRGTESITASGKPCQSWETFLSRYSPEAETRFRVTGLGNHSYCRSLEGTTAKPFCFLTEDNAKGEHCNIPECPEREEDEHWMWSKECKEFRGKRISLNGGNNISKIRIPWFVAIFQRSNNEESCGGAIISQYWILSSAHCFTDYSAPNRYYGVAGKIFMHKFEGTKRRILFTRLWPHEQFERNSLKNDILLIKVSNRIQYSADVLPICISTQISKDERKVFNTGWLNSHGTNTSDVLRTATLPLITRKRCTKFMSNLSEGTMCAGDANGRMATCKGKGGNPLFGLNDLGGYELLGILSWGVGCARPDQAGVFTQVHHYRTWINQTVALTIT